MTGIMHQTEPHLAELPVAPARPEAGRRRPEARKTSRATLNFLVDGSLLLLLLSVVWTATILQFVFPPAGVAQGWTLWGWTYDRWTQVHGGCLALFCLNILLHVMLHWSWIFGLVGTRWARWRGYRFVAVEATKTLYGVCTLISVLTLLGTLYAVAEFSIRPPPSRIETARDGSSPAPGLRSAPRSMRNAHDRGLPDR